MNILSSMKHFIKKGDKLFLSYKTFPYPPFGNYKLIDHDDKIIVKHESSTNNIFCREGSSLEHTIYFTFIEKGMYKLTINNLNSDIDMCFQIYVDVDEID